MYVYSQHMYTMLKDRRVCKRKTQESRKHTCICTYIRTYMCVHTYMHHAIIEHMMEHRCSTKCLILLFLEKGGTPPKKMVDMMKDPPKNGEMALWPNTRVVKCKMFHKSKMGSIIRSSGTVFNSLLYLNSRLGGPPKKKMEEMMEEMVEHRCVIICSIIFVKRKHRCSIMRTYIHTYIQTFKHLYTNKQIHKQTNTQTYIRTTHL